MGRAETFAEIMAVTLGEVANENRRPADIVNAIVYDLTVAGFAVRRTYERVAYHRDIIVLYEPGQTGISGASHHDAMMVLEAGSAVDLRGEHGWLVVWSERGRKRSAWFDAEGKSPILTDYRVANPRTPVAGAFVPLPDGQKLRVA
ncbi:MAG: hypothetical protein JKY47_00880 [Thalassospira sp.]|jgi:hypothetical protein|uniref:hypothetical protein n=1 Tax=unclassified Thalassospira TaxID=2648997 RepID=UPI000D76F5C4|nr:MULTISPECIES: hypothetical protein [unclassified Thalassospira]MBL4839366.1 hypothetical protein [Thalassospira sp.]PXX36250.1 hypothetical protein C7967_101643 [Thalassospira sp. 11-3]QPL37455.1 hypothetical protein IT971_09280 [Thalassospira sp. B30-1]